MTYYKNLSNNYIASVSTGCGQVPIIKSEYDAILEVIRNKPKAPDGYDYLLRADTLDWELVQMPPAPPAPDHDDEEISAEEAMSIITGGVENET